MVLPQLARPISTEQPAGTPSCSLLLTDHQAVSALCASDVQGVLDSMLQGTCALSGQVEPFIWFIGRLAEWQREVSVES